MNSRYSKLTCSCWSWDCTTVSLSFLATIWSYRDWQIKTELKITSHATPYPQCLQLSLLSADFNILLLGLLLQPSFMLLAIRERHQLLFEEYIRIWCSLPSVFVALSAVCWFQHPSLGLVAAAFLYPPSHQSNSKVMYVLEYLFYTMFHTLSVCSSLCCLLIWVALSRSSVPCCWSWVSLCWSWVSFISTSTCNLSMLS